MYKIVKLISIVLALTMLSLPVLCETSDTGSSDTGSRSDTSSSDTGRSDVGSHDSSQTTSSTDSGTSSTERSSSDDKVKEMYDSGSGVRDSEGVKGLGFVNREDNNYGDYVTFSVDNTSGEVKNYGIAGSAVFDSIDISGFDFERSKTEGAQTKITSKDGSAEIHIHDNPSAIMEIDANKYSNVTLNLSQGVSASKKGDIVEIDGRNFTGYLISEKADSINIAGREISIDNSKGKTVFRTSPSNMPHDDMELRFVEEVRTKRAGAEVSVGKSDKSSIVNFSDYVNVTVDSVEKNHVRMTVNSTDHAGKFILMNVDNSSLSWKEGEKISLHLDNEGLNEVETEQKLYNATESSFWLNKTGKNKLQALVYIKNFSVRRLDIVVAAGNQTPTPVPTLTTPVTTTTTATPTSGFGLVLAAIATIVAVYTVRRKL